VHLHKSLVDKLPHDPFLGNLTQSLECNDHYDFDYMSPELGGIMLLWLVLSPLTNQVTWARVEISQSNLNCNKKHERRPVTIIGNKSSIRRVCNLCSLVCVIIDNLTIIFVLDGTILDQFLLLFFLWELQREHHCFLLLEFDRALLGFQGCYLSDGIGIVVIG